MFLGQINYLQFYSKRQIYTIETYLIVILSKGHLEFV
jgi:hypothetical protein